MLREEANKVKVIHIDEKGNSTIKQIAYHLTRNPGFMARHKYVLENGEAPPEITKTKKAKTTKAKKTETLDLVLEGVMHDNNIIVFGDNEGNSLSLDFTQAMSFFVPPTKKIVPTKPEKKLIKPNKKTTTKKK